MGQCSTPPAHSTSSTCLSAELLPGLRLGCCEVTACPLALRGHALNRIQDPALSLGHALSCARVPALCEPCAELCPGLSPRPGPLNPPVPCSPAPGVKHRAMPSPQPSSGPTDRAPSCSPGSAPSQPVHRAAARSYATPGLPSPAALREVSARFPAPSTDLRRGPGPVPARPCPLPQPAPRTAAAALPETAASARTTPTAAATPTAQAVRRQRTGKAAPPRFGNTDST